MQPVDGDKPPSRRFLGLRVSTEVNLLALAAFVLSVGGLLWQAWLQLVGAQVELYIGERVNIAIESHPMWPDSPFLLLNANLAYINSGAVGKDALVTRERLTILEGDAVALEYIWLNFENWNRGEDGRYSASGSMAAHSFAVPGKSSVAHQTTFSGFLGSDSVQHAYSKGDTLWMLEGGNDIVVIVSASFLHPAEGPPLRAACILKLAPRIIESLDQSGFETVLCDPVPVPNLPRN